MLAVERLRRTPVLYALVSTGSIVGAVGGIYSVTKDIFQLPTPSLALLYHAAYLVVILFLSVLAFEYRSKRQTGPLGKSFEYDRDGVLWHGGEKAIAFRVVTFLALLERVGQSDSEKPLENIFFDAGRASGSDFGQQFGTHIYPSELQKGGTPFRELSRSNRLKLWAEYDSSTGWGLLEAHEKPKSADIVVKHSTLFKGNGGRYFAYFLAGYCETVINAITSDFGAPLKLSDPVKIYDRSIEFTLSAER